MCEIYRIFSNDWSHICDYSDKSKIELYNHESYGTSVSNKNGYFVGKKWLGVHVKMWKEDIDKGLLLKQELYEDHKFPKWWLDSIFKEKIK